jgi:hypothetical protein
MAGQMVRKEFELTPEEAAKLARVAAERGCSEDEVVRAAIETMERPSQDNLEWERIGSLRVSKLRKLTPAEERQREEDRRWLALQPYAGLSEAIIEERQSGY